MAASLADGPMYGNIVQDINQMFLDLESTVKDGFQDLKREVRREKLKTPDIPPPGDNEAARVFALMKSLDAGDQTRKAPLHRVFRLLVLDGLSQNAVARRCQCSAALISLRVKEIERRMNLSLPVLRTLATRIGELGPVEDSRAGNIYRRGLKDDTRQDSVEGGF
jgi:hypothetical protein